MFKDLMWVLSMGLSLMLILISSSEQNQVLPYGLEKKSKVLMGAVNIIIMISFT